MAKNKIVSQSKLNKAIDAIVVRLEKTENFVLDQAPDVCKEIIKEETACGIFDTLIGGAVSTGLISLSIFATRFCNPSANSSSLDPMWPYVLFGLSALIGAVFIIVTMFSLRNLISLTVAPKLMILRGLKELLNTDKEE